MKKKVLILLLLPLFLAATSCEGTPDSFSSEDNYSSDNLPSGDNTLSGGDEPVDPIIPSGGDEPVDPIDPDEPVDPTIPDEPVDPINPDKPVYRYYDWKDRINVSKDNYVEVDESLLRDKALGAIIGNAIGLGSGFEYIHDPNVEAVTPEGTNTRVALADKYFETDGYLCSGTLGENNNKSNCYVFPPYTYLCDPRIGKGYIISDDDMTVDIMFQYLLREKGPFIDAYDIIEAWSSKGYGVHDAGGGQDARRMIDDLQYIAPYIGQQQYGNSQWFITEPWIENDLLGVNFPYMAKSCDTLASFVGSVSGDGYGLYLGRLCALMTSLAYEYNDAKVIMEKAFDYLDKNNMIYEMYKFVKNEYENNVPWREACVKIADRRIWTHFRPDGTNSGGFSADFSMTSNAGMIMLGLFYGENDFIESVKITSLAGLDGDCTAASVGQIMGTLVGFNAFPQEYKDYLNGNSYFYNYTGSSANKEEYNPGWDGAFSYCDDKMPYKTSVNQLVDIVIENTKNQILAFGGSKNGDTYRIIKQELPHTDYVEIENFSFEKADTSGWKSENATLSYNSNISNFRTKDNYGCGTLEGYGKAYQEVELIPGHEYKVSLYVNRICDKEFRLFANDQYLSQIRTEEFQKYYIEKYYRKAYQYDDNFFHHYYFTFIANQKDYKIGIELINSNFGSATSINFDDLEISDVTGYNEPYYQSKNINDFYGNTGTSNVNNNAHLTANSSLKFEFDGYKGLQYFKFFVDNSSQNLDDLTIYIDNVYRGKLPIQANGEVDFSLINSRDAIYYAGPGKHIMKLTLSKGESLDINRVEIFGTNPYSDVI